MYPWKLYDGCEAFDYSANSDAFCPDADALAYALARTIMAPVNGESISLDMSRAKVARLASGEDVYSFLSGAAVVFGDGTRSAFSAALSNGTLAYFEFGETEDVYKRQELIRHVVRNLFGKPAGHEVVKGKCRGACKRAVRLGRKIACWQYPEQCRENKHKAHVKYREEDIRKARPVFKRHLKREILFSFTVGALARHCFFVVICHMFHPLRI